MKNYWDMPKRNPISMKQDCGFIEKYSDLGKRSSNFMSPFSIPIFFIFEYNPILSHYTAVNIMSFILFYQNKQAFLARIRHYSLSLQN